MKTPDLLTAMPEPTPAPSSVPSPAPGASKSTSRTGDTEKAWSMLIAFNEKVESV